ncbi:hypothetical protein ACFOU2_05305 [Bacillus songklensis]|uniref:Uncharacterized protein n=1 Tax=Bacillus songklensis TaxID=1069116 RepID=A0ABV8AZQ9_9BACI
MERKTKKQIIISEIEWWKESHLLPEQYCDYLLALYTEGNRNNQKNNVNQSNPTRKHKRWIAGIILLFLPVILLVIYFTELSFVLQMLLYSLFVLVCLGTLLFFIKKRFLLHGLLVISAFCVLFITYKTASYYFPNNMPVMSALLILQCLMWFITGVILRIPYFKIAGVLGVFVVLVFNLL